MTNSQDNTSQGISIDTLQLLNNLNSTTSDSPHDQSFNILTLLQHPQLLQALLQVQQQLTGQQTQQQGGQQLLQQNNQQLQQTQYQGSQQSQQHTYQQLQQNQQGSQQEIQQEQELANERRRRRSYRVLLPQDFRLDIPVEIVNALWDEKKRDFSKTGKTRLSEYCCNKIYVENMEFSFSNERAVITTALENELQGYSRPQIGILYSAIKNYRRNHLTGEGMPYHADWLKEMDHKQKKYKSKDQRTYITCSGSKSKPTAKVMWKRLPDVRMSQSEFAMNIADLKKYVRAEEASEEEDEHIAHLLSASFLQRNQKLRAPDNAYNFQVMLSDFPILHEPKFLFYEWILVMQHLNTPYLPFDNFRDKIKSLIKFMVYYMINQKEHSNLLDALEGYFLQRASREAESKKKENEDSEDVHLTEEDINSELTDMHKETVLIQLLTSPDFDKYCDILLMHIIYYIERTHKIRGSTRMIRICDTSVTSEDMAPFIAAMRPNRYGAYSSYSVILDSCNIVSVDGLTDALIFFHCCCQIGFRKHSNTIIDSLVNEAIIRRSCGNDVIAYTTFKNKLRLFHDVADKKVQDLFPDFYSFYLLSHKSVKLPSSVIDLDKIFVAPKKKTVIESDKKKTNKKKTNTTENTEKKKKNTSTDSDMDLDSDTEYTEKSKKNKKMKIRTEKKKKNKSSDSEMNLNSDTDIEYTEKSKKKSTTYTENTVKKKKSTTDKEKKSKKNLRRVIPETAKVDDTVIVFCGDVYMCTGKIFALHERTFKVHFVEYDPIEYADVVITSDQEFFMDGEEYSAGARIACEWKDMFYQEEEEEHDEEELNVRHTGTKRQVQPEAELPRSKRQRTSVLCTECSGVRVYRFVCTACSRPYCVDCIVCCELCRKRHCSSCLVVVEKDGIKWKTCNRCLE